MNLFVRNLKDSRRGYTLILPALAILCAIAIWPVLRSFWISLYDIRLNDPAKSRIHASHGIDMEKFAGSLPLLVKSLGSEADTAGRTVQARILQRKLEVEQIKHELEEDEAAKERYEQVTKLLYDFQPVPEEIKYLNVSNDKAERWKAKLDEIRQELQNDKEQGQLKRPDEAIGLARSVQDSFVAPNFVGLKHYKAFFAEKRFWTSIGNTLIFTLYAVTVEMAVGFIIALLINKPFAGRGLVRAAVLIPWATPTAISAMVWQFLYNGQHGIIAKLFAESGLISDMSVLLSTKAGAFFSVILADVWKTSPFVALLLLAGLQTIPGSLYEAAQVDGASRWRLFLHITLPQMRMPLLVTLMFRTLDAFRVFDLIYVLTGGGPANATESISMYAYQTMFAKLDFGAGSALSVIVFLFIAGICMVYVKLAGADFAGKRGV